MSYQRQHYNSPMASPKSCSNNDHTSYVIPLSIATQRENLSSLKWRDQINNNRNNWNKAKENSDGGLGIEVMKLLKKASHDKKIMKGKRRPLGNVSNGNKLLQSKALAKKELESIQNKLPDMC